MKKNTKHKTIHLFGIYVYVCISIIPWNIQITYRLYAGNILLPKGYLNSSLENYLHTYVCIYVHVLWRYIFLRIELVYTYLHLWNNYRFLWRKSAKCSLFTVYFLTGFYILITLLAGNKDKSCIVNLNNLPIGNVKYVHA